MFDTHAHLFDKKLFLELDTILNKINELNYKGVMCICENEFEVDNFLKYYKQYNFLYCAIGVHPHNAKHFDKNKFNELYQKLQKTKRLSAIGEIGLDFYYNFSDKDIQIKIFNDQLDLVKTSSLPVIVHSRNANDIVYEILKEHNISRGVMHCYNGDIFESKKFLELEFKLGIPGIVTFKTATKLKEVVSKVPSESLVIETDAPYLSPEPFRGKINTPLNLKYILQTISFLRNSTIEELEEILDKNSFELFGITPTIR